VELPKTKRPAAAAPTLFEAPAPAPPAPPAPQLEPAQQRVWDALAAPRHGDDLARELNLSVSELSMLLMKLEMKRLVRRLPGNQYERR
jgi:DNA processing protein